MENDIRISNDMQVGYGFVPAQYLHPGEDEYRIRNIQFVQQGKSLAAFRNLKAPELEILIRNHNTCNDWSKLLVSDPFEPELLGNNFFAGLIRIGKLERVSLEHHDLQLFAGINSSRIISCDIGDNCAISNCSYLAHYIIGDNCILLDNSEIHVSNHAKFGNGIIMEGESEDVRISIDVMNEVGGRSIRPFNGMNCADAYLWAKLRDDEPLMAAFDTMTDSMFERRRGRYGTIAKSSVLKSNRIIKDVAIGESAYIKGTNKLKNLTINSKEDARTQIGEGVELVNGIIGYACKVFYGSKAVRFIMGDNSSLKYGARLIHSVLGENSTVSCCEILNNLIFPAHEQHHNTSFLIASHIKGQSNMAAGATIGSNHNSRAPDGEIEAGRGFWPGLCTSLKHSSRFASFCLLAKGDYRYELDIPFPFCLTDNDYRQDSLVLVPAYWWTNNLYALMRNESKFKARDKRTDKTIRFEYSPFAPDTAEEILKALSLLETWTGRACLNSKVELDTAGADLQRQAMEIAARGREDAQNAALAALGRHLLQSLKDPLAFDVEAIGVENSSRRCLIHKPARAWQAYREILVWFAGRTVCAYAKSLPGGELLAKVLDAKLEDSDGISLDTHWENLGGLLVSSTKLEKMLEKARQGFYPTWREFHRDYEELSGVYELDRARYAWLILGLLYPAQQKSAAETPTDPATGQRTHFAITDRHSELLSRKAPLSSCRVSNPRRGPSKASLETVFRDLDALSEKVEREIYKSRAKDWDNPFRKATFRNENEMKAVLGQPENSSNIRALSEELVGLRSDLRMLGASLEKEG
ncbi:MAG: DUF4954 family protein [Spirochaetaceae bacterium]|nr:DUF4954 family protein [Spirochaetaceae bacterium]